MPFLDEQELSSLHKQIQDTNEQKEEVESELENLEDDYNSLKKHSKITNIVFGVLSGIALALAIFFYTRKGGGVSEQELIAIKKAEATRVIDSLQTAYADNIEQEYDEDGNPIESSEDSSVDQGVQSMKDKVSGEKIYSVQIGAFSRKKHPLLSETIAGTSINAELYKYSVGLFKSLNEAQSFRKELVKLGFNDAFVASYIDGKRQKIELPN